MKNIKEIPFRKDNYGANFYLQLNGSTTVYATNKGIVSNQFFNGEVKDIYEDQCLIREITIIPKVTIKCERLGMRLGIDTCMVKYPEWDDKLFPTAVRCENNGFWGCFCSPKGDMLAVCSPSDIVSWRNEYATFLNDVGHRINTTSIEFLNTLKLPDRHKKVMQLDSGKEYIYRIYMQFVADKNELKEFVKARSGINIQYLLKYTLEKGELPQPYDSGFEYTITDSNNNSVNNLDYGHYRLQGSNDDSEVSVYVRKDWWYYLTTAKNNADICQQKAGSHTESWYGYFAKAAYAKYAKDLSYTNKLLKEFDAFFNVLTTVKKGKIAMRKKAHPHRLQNSSQMISLLADMYEISGNIKYLDNASDLADWLMQLQSSDGSYRSFGIHYTCVIYPAKSMLELAQVEKACGLTERFEKHFKSATKAIDNLYEMLDNIGTEGQMTFEDGMISCESLQLGYLATLIDDNKRKDELINASEYIYNKHKCLQQRFIPDARTSGATLRFWEARYDINMNSNMFNTPHGWTSWKTYATYYLYILTGKLDYLVDMMNTIGACMQMIDSEGKLRWSYAPEPCLEVRRMVKSNNKYGIDFVPEVIGETYLSMVSDWYRQPDRKLGFQYIRLLSSKHFWKSNYGGSCDNDVFEHFKCLEETVFGKAFAHQITQNEWITYNCTIDNNALSCNDKFVNQFIVYCDKFCELIICGADYKLNIGVNVIKNN